MSERTLLASSCTEAAEAAVAILTTGMAPDAGDVSGSEALQAARAAERAPRDVPPPSGAAAADARDLSPSAERGSPRVAPELAARVGIDFGTLAAPAPFGQLLGGIELGRFAALGFVGATGEVLGDAAGTSSGAEMSLVFGGLSGCYRFTEHNPIASGCVGAELGSLDARGVGTASARTGHAAWSASLAQGGLDWELGAASVSMGVTAVVPFRQLRVVLAPEEVHRTPALAARPWLGFGMRFR